MQPSNPACYECVKAEIHTWKRNEDGTAQCTSCKIKLTVEQAREVFNSN